MPGPRSHAIIGASAAAASALAGIVGGFLANQWNWGLAAGALTLVAVFVGLEGLKAIKDTRAVPPDPDPTPQVITTAPGPDPAARVWQAETVHMRQSVVAGHIGHVDMSRKTHVHVGGLVAVVLAGLLLVGTAGGTATYAFGQGGRLGGDTTPPAAGAARYTGLFERVSGPPWLAYFGLTAQQYQQTFNDLDAKGFRLVRLCGYSTGDDERFAPIFEQSSGPPRRAVHGRISQYQAVFDELTGHGYRVVQFNGYAIRGEEWYTAVFEHADGPPWLAYHGLTAPQYRQTYDDLASKGFRLVQLNGYAVQGLERFAPIFEQTGGPPIRAVYSLTAGQYQQQFDELTKQGFRLAHLSGYALNGEERLAAIFEQADGPAQAPFHGLTGQQYQQRFDELTQQGYRLSQISGYTVS